MTGFSVFSGLLGWAAFSVAIETSSYFDTFAAGALAIILFELGIFYWIFSVVLAIDLFGSRKDNPILSAKRLLGSSVFIGASSTILFAILISGPTSPLVSVYLLIASLTPVFVYTLMKKKNGDLEIQINE